jgi:hypothetical protein
MAELLRRNRAPAEVMLVLAAEDAQLRKAFAKAGRNGPCPCGSGRTFKHYHGRYILQRGMRFVLPLCGSIRCHMRARDRSLGCTSTWTSHAQTEFLLPRENGQSTQSALRDIGEETSQQTSPHLPFLPGITSNKHCLSELPDCAA